MDRLNKLRKRTAGDNININLILKAQEHESKNMIKREKIEIDEDPEVEITSSSSTTFSDLMEIEEVNEQHLQDAIKYNSKIPVPDIAVINEEDYDKLYPAIVQMPRSRLVPHPHDDTTDYDIDSEDEQWLEENSGKFNLPIEKFEAYLEFLENNCSKKSIPKIGDIMNFFKSHCPAAIQEVYDYWLDKRLKGRGRKLIHEVAVGNVLQNRGNIKRTANNPYVAFRSRPEKMRLRKNRTRDCENYMQMVQLRRSMGSYVDACHSMLEKEKARHELLKDKCKMFQASYKKQEFSSIRLKQNDDIDLDFLLGELKKDSMSVDGCIDEEPDYRESENPYSVAHKDGNQYYQANDYYDIDSGEHETYNYSMRRRIGRGGRIIIDRFTTSSEFQPFPLARHVLLHQFENNKKNSSSGGKVGSSFFRLQQRKITELDLSDYELVLE